MIVERGRSRLRNYTTSWKSEQEAQELHEQTIMFWNLQLQFLSGNFTELQMLSLIKGIKNCSRLNTLRYNGDWEEYKMELATHLALQLSGLENV